jgi:hypothetical protein
MGPRAQFFLATVAVASLLFIARMLRSKQLKPKYAILWLSIGLGMVALSLSPRLLDGFSDWIGIDYAPATLFLVTDVMLLLIAVHFSWELSRLEDRSRTLAQELALLSVTKPEQAADGQNEDQHEEQGSQRDPSPDPEGHR